MGQEVSKEKLVLPKMAGQHVKADDALKLLARQAKTYGTFDTR